MWYRVADFDDAIIDFSKTRPIFYTLIKVLASLGEFLL